MAIKLEITGNDTQEFAAQLAQVIGVFAPMLRPMNPVPTTGSGETEAPKPPKAKVEKAEKSKAEPAKALTIDDVRAKLKKLGEEKGHDAAYAILEGFKVEKASALKPEDYASAIAKIDEALGAA